MFDAVPYRLLVRRVRSGDCDKIGELYAIVEPDLTAFCQSLTEDFASARRAADGAFVFAAELLASQSVTVASFRSTLLAEAKGRCYSEIGRASQAELSGEPVDAPIALDMDQLQQRLEQLRPDALDDPVARLTWRSRLAPSTAVSVVLLMVVMIEMAALGLDLIPKQPAQGDSRNAGAQTRELQRSSSSVALQNPEIQSVERDDADRRDGAEIKRTPQADEPDARKPASEQPASSKESSKQEGSPTSDVALPQVPVADKIPELPVPEVKVEVDAGPISANVGPKSESGILPQTSTCVGSTCISTP